LGYPDQSLDRNLEALRLARELNHPYSVTLALLHSCLHHYLRRQPRAVQEYAGELVHRSTEGSFPMMLAWGNSAFGWARAQQGEGEEGISQMHQGLAGWRSIGSGYGLPLLLAKLANGYEMAGQQEKGLDLLEEALEHGEKTGERAWEAGIYRNKGELLQSSGKVEEAEVSFRQAIEVARRQEAKSWELRATLSLSRLLQEQGRSAEARPLLSEIYGWFTEGFDTPDLQETKALLEELGR
jgi:predicted ATPase